LDACGVAVPPAERAMARDLCFGVVRRLNTLDGVLSPLLSRPFPSLDPSVRAALRFGAWQLLYAADRFPAYAVLNDTVSLVGPRARGLVNAVLRSLQRKGRPPAPVDPIEKAAVEYSYPVWLVKRWTDRWGRETAGRVMEAGNAEPPLTLRANRLKISAATLAARLAAEGRPAKTTSLSPDGVRVEKSFSLTDHPAFREGLFSVQDEAAQWAVHALDPKPGETVLDLCAGAGGKSGYMAERMENRGRVVAVDSDVPRLDHLRRMSARLGLHIVEAVVDDARNAGVRWPGIFDRVLADVPCSGLGAIRRRPDIKWARGEEDVRTRLPALQKEILSSAAKALKPGGMLVYATCTTEPEENEDVVGGFLSERPDFRPDPFVHLRPDLHGTDGFFLVPLRLRA
jgi:16S rRNA (cytosine967-C5)-methyltransferase